MEKYCKVISTYFGSRHRRAPSGGSNRGIEWPRHGQYAKDANMSLDNLKFVLDVENNLDSGVSHDTIVVNNDSGFDEGREWLNSLHESKTKNGKFLVVHRENKGRNFAAFRGAYEKYKDEYDYFMFIADDHVMLAVDYYKKTLIQYKKDEKENNGCLVSLAGTSDIRSWPIHAHDGMILIHKKYIEEGIERFGPLPSADDSINYISENSDVIYDHVEFGEIPFSNRYVQLGYKIFPFGYNHKYDEYGRTSATWPVLLDSQIYLTPTYNVLYDHDCPGSVNVDDFKVDETIYSIIKNQKESIKSHGL